MTSTTGNAILAGILILAGSIWTGGLVAIAVVVRAARGALAPADRVAFFRALGRSYGIVGTAALAVAILSGAALLSGRDWDGLLISTAVLTVVLVLTLAFGVVQARRMTALRRSSLNDPQNAELAAQVRRGAPRAAALRALIGLLTLALVALAAVLAVD